MCSAATVFLDENLKIAHWWLFDGHSKKKETARSQTKAKARQGQGQRWQDIAAAQPERLIIVLPASLVYHSQVSVPSEDPRVLQQSVPFAIEEELASSIEANHVAWQQVDKGQAVAVIDKSLMHSLAQTLSEQGLTAAVVTSALYFVPQGQTSQTILPANGAKESNTRAGSTQLAKTLKGAVLRRGRWRGGFIPAAALNEQSSPSQDFPAIAEQMESALPEDYVNLLQGEFARKDKQSGGQKYWRWLLVLLGGLLLSGLLVNAIKYWRLDSQQGQLRSLQQQTFREAFVDASPAELADPVNAMRSRIKLLQTSQGQGSGALMRLLAGLSAVREQMPAVRIQNVHWRNNRLEVQVLAPSVEQVNRLQQLLRDQSLHWRVTTGTREAVADGVKSIIVIEVLP